MPNNEHSAPIGRVCSAPQEPDECFLHPGQKAKGWITKGDNRRGVCDADKTICIEDFCGTHRGFHIEFWADYWPDHGVVTFGGDWEDVPTMTWENDGIPTDRDAWSWAEKHDWCLGD